MRVSLKKGLGKGLGALISAPEAEEEVNVIDKKEQGGVIEIDINKIEPNKNQPRKYFDDEALMELAESIKQYGVISPLIVNKEDGYYSIIAGERRWRAARIAKVASVPVIIKEYTPAEVLEVALIENLQRKDLNPIEEAVCYKRLIDEFFFTQESIAEKIGKSRNSISYAVRLLNLDERVQHFIMDGKLSAGHGHCLLNVKEPIEQVLFAEKAIETGVSVREIEKMIKSYYNNLQKMNEKNESYSKNMVYTNLESDLQHIFGTKVNIKNKQDKGKIEIEYYSPDELDRLLGLFKKIEA